MEATTSILETIGITGGDRIIVAVRNSWRYPIIVLASWRRGAVVCPVNPYNADDLLLRHIRLADASLIITERIHVDRFNRLINLPAASVERIAGVLYPGKPQHRPIRLQLNQPATMFFLNDNGRCRGIVHTVESHYYSAVGSNLNIRLHSSDRWLVTSAPHILSSISVMLRCLLSGACMVIPDSEAGLVTSLERYGITHASLTPGQFAELLASGADADRLPHLRHIIVRGIPPREQIQLAESRRFRVHPCYGSVEMASQIAVSSDTDSPEHRATSGRPLPYRQVKVDEKGNIHVRGRTLFTASVSEASPSGEADASGEFEPGGWFNTGDTGTLDADGYLTIHQMRYPERDW